MIPAALFTLQLIRESGIVRGEYPEVLHCGRRETQVPFREWKVFFIVAEVSLKFVPKDPIDNNPALFQIMARRRIGDNPLSEPMLTRFTDAYMQD